MKVIALALVGLPLVFVVYAYLVYPLLLLAFSTLWGTRNASRKDAIEWPSLSISLPAYNEEATIRRAIEALLVADYPEDRRQIVVVSDASTDRTEQIVREYESRGVELVCLDKRGGKTAAENVAIPHLRGDVIVNTDASVRIAPDALKAIARPFQDPDVGVVSGRDVSVDAQAKSQGSNPGEAVYVGYEMWVRKLESHLGGIVGASGCFYAIRADLHQIPVPGHLSRDFAAALTAREYGYRSLSLSDAVCYVPRTLSLRSELRRKARTMGRGLVTLWKKRGLLNPFSSYCLFAWKLFSHKLCRWLFPVTVLFGLMGLVTLTVLEGGLWYWVAGAGTLILLSGAAALSWCEDQRVTCPQFVSICGYIVVGTVAGLQAWSRALFGEGEAIWEPTRRTN